MNNTLSAMLLYASVAACLGQKPLAENPDEAAFKQQLHGEWVKCAPDYTPKPGEGRASAIIKEITFKPDGSAHWKEEPAGNMTGRYSVEFEHPPSPGLVPPRKIILISAGGRSITLTRVNFGEDNRFKRGETFLRIEGPDVYQVFRMKKSQQDAP